MSRENLSESNIKAFMEKIELDKARFFSEITADPIVQTRKAFGYKAFSRLL